MFIISGRKIGRLSLIALLLIMEIGKRIIV